MFGKIAKPGVLILLTLLVANLAALAGTRIEREVDLSPGGEFHLDTDVGSVTVTGTSGSGARILITSRNEELLDRFDLEIEGGGDRVEVRFEERGRGPFSWGRGQNVKFEIQVPGATRLDIDTAGGFIRVSEIDASVRLDTSGGSITATRIGGEVEADTSGGSITIEEADGNVNADTSGGGITLRGIRGDARADTSGGSIVIEDVTGDIKADTSGGGIEIRGVGGLVTADTSGGSISVTFASGNQRGGSLSTSGGGIEVFLDRGANLELDASASGGSVTANLPVTVEGRITKTALRGKIGSGGPVLRLRTSGGRIRINPL